MQPLWLFLVPWWSELQVSKISRKVITLFKFFNGSVCHNFPLILFYCGPVKAASLQKTAEISRALSTPQNELQVKGTIVSFKYDGKS